MERRKFLKYTTATIVIAGITYYLSTDTSNFERADLQESYKTIIPILADEKEILELASLAPSGHNTQPWFIKYKKPYHWIICNDKSKWLSAVDPTQRETILSIGAFVQNLEYAANNLGYNCDFNLLATNNQAEEILIVRLVKRSNIPKFDIQKIRNRRTLRSNYLNDTIKEQDLNYLFENEIGSLHYFSPTSKEHEYLNEQTINANKIQSYRNDAQIELSNWIRFSNNEVQKYCDGLSVASMEIDGISAWIVRNFYDKRNVIKKDFRDKSIDTIKKQVAQSGGWIIITSPDNSVFSLLETGKRLQRIWLKAHEKNIAIHPMTQILEEVKTRDLINISIGIIENIQFLLRVGYVKNYPKPVTLRRPIAWFMKS